MACLSSNRHRSQSSAPTTTETIARSFVNVQQPNTGHIYPPTAFLPRAAHPANPTTASFIPDPASETSSRCIPLPMSMNASTTTQGVAAAAGGGGGWTAYIRQLGKKDPADGVTRNWVKRGREPQLGGVLEVDDTVEGEVVMVAQPMTSLNVYPPTRTAYQPNTNLEPYAKHAPQNPALPPQRSPTTASPPSTASPPYNNRGSRNNNADNNKRPQSFYLPSDRIAHFQQAARDGLERSGGGA